ncbi:hypothetical protein [Aeromonas bestiarum]|jgi:hypothetical protein|uniref:hypothetical protein n=1 Tax=Aeromonas bestiarum TaxID=105751 RepID=UPI0032B21C4D
MFNEILWALRPDNWSWEGWLYATLFILSLWLMARGRSAYVVIALAALFLLLESTYISSALSGYGLQQARKQAENQEVCADIQDQEQVGSLNFKYQECVDSWVNLHDPKMKLIYLAEFIFIALCNLLRAAAFLCVFAMLKNNELRRVGEVINWYRARAHHG